MKNGEGLTGRHGGRVPRSLRIGSKQTSSSKSWVEGEDNCLHHWGRGEHVMRITDVTVTVWEWKDIPATRYTRTTASSKSRRIQMGLVHITTDESVKGM